MLKLVETKVKFLLSVSGISHTHLMNRKRQREAKCVPKVEGNFTQLPDFRRGEWENCEKGRSEKFQVEQKVLCRCQCRQCARLRFLLQNAPFFNMSVAKNNYQKSNEYTCFHTATPILFISLNVALLFTFDLVTRTFTAFLC